MIICVNVCRLYVYIFYVMACIDINYNRKHSKNEDDDENL